MKIDVFETMEMLAGVFGPSGRESAAAEKIMELARPYADEITVDIMGNVTARKVGGGKKVMFSAHMDTIGVVVTHIDECGYLRFANLGGVSPVDALGSLVAFADGTRGVIGCDGKADSKNLKLDNFFIDIGARSREEARAKVRPGYPAVYDQPCIMLGHNMTSPCLSGRIGCVALLAAMEKIENPTNDLYFLFSAQGELGYRGAKTAAFTIGPDCGIIVGVTKTGDIPGTTSPPSDVKLGGGAAIKIMDPSVMCHPRVVKFLQKKAETGNIPHQMEVLLNGGTCSFIVQVSRGGAYTGGISIPVRYVHSSLEMCDLSDVEACVELIVAASKISLKL